MATEGSTQTTQTISNNENQMTSIGTGGPITPEQEAAKSQVEWKSVIFHTVPTLVNLTHTVWKFRNFSPSEIYAIFHDIDFLELGRKMIVFETLDLSLLFSRKIWEIS